MPIRVNACDRRAAMRLALAGGSGALLAGCGAARALAQSAPAHGAVAIREVIVPVKYVPASQGGIYVRHIDMAGPAVILAHPATGSAHVFDDQLARLAAAGFHPIAFSRRGHRGSTTVAAHDGTTSDDIDALADHFGLSDFHALGSAAGGGLVLEYAVNRPARLRSIVLACSVTNIVDPELSEWRAGLMPAPFGKMSAAFRELSPEYRAANPEAVAHWEELEETSREPGSPLGPPPAPAVTRDQLAALKVPGLWIAGGADLYSPPANVRYVQEQVQGSEFAMIELAGHSAYWEYPKEFAALAVPFMQRH